MIFNQSVRPFVSTRPVIKFKPKQILNFNQNGHLLYSSEFRRAWMQKSNTHPSSMTFYMFLITGTGLSLTSYYCLKSAITGNMWKHKIRFLFAFMIGMTFFKTGSKVWKNHRVIQSISLMPCGKDVQIRLHFPFTLMSM